MRSLLILLVLGLAAAVVSAQRSLGDAVGGVGGISTQGGYPSGTPIGG
nr:venom peptide [Acharia stimulea]